MTLAQEEAPVKHAIMPSMEVSWILRPLPSILAVVTLLFLMAGLRALSLGRKTISFRHRRQRLQAGWWLIGSSMISALLAIVLVRASHSPSFPLPNALPAQPSPLPSPTIALPTLSITPSLTPLPSPTFTPTLSVASSPNPSATPRLPLSLEIMILSAVTPLPSAAIYDVRFTQAVAGEYPITNRTEWTNPIWRMYVNFAYNNMTYGAQFSVLWFRNGELVYFESQPWPYSRRGRASYKWQPAMHEWHPGLYEVQFFVGLEWKATGRFIVRGEPRPPTSTLTPSPTRTPRPTWTLTVTSSPRPTRTPTVSPTSTSPPLTLTP